jgi:hypothetical protein
MSYDLFPEWTQYGMFALQKDQETKNGSKEVHLPNKAQNTRKIFQKLSFQQ